MPYEANELLDLPPGRGQRAEGVEFELQNHYGARLGVIHPESRGSSLRFDSKANITRQISGLTITAQEYADINPASDRVAPFWLLEDGTRWPLGVYYFTGGPEDDNATHTAPLFDGGIILDALTHEAFGVRSGESVSNAMVILANRLGIAAQIDGSNTVVPDDQPVGWLAGQQSWLTIFRYLCDLCGFLPPHFGFEGELRCRAVPPMAIGPTTIAYSTSDGRVQPNPTKDPNYLDAPNAHIVVATGATTQAIFAISYIDPDLPWSKERRWLNPKVWRMQGVGSSAQAQVIADRKAQVSAEEFTTVEFTGPPDPRHDCFEVVSYDGVAYRETGWELELRAGGNHRHRLSRPGALDNAP